MMPHRIEQFLLGAPPEGLRRGGIRTVDSSVTAAPARPNSISHPRGRGRINRFGKRRRRHDITDYDEEEIFARKAPLSDRLATRVDQQKTFPSSTRGRGGIFSRRPRGASTAPTRASGVDAVGGRHGADREVWAASEREESAEDGRVNGSNGARKPRGVRCVAARVRAAVPYPRSRSLSLRKELPRCRGSRIEEAFVFTTDGSGDHGRRRPPT